jgi:hypothetical protein
MRLNFICQEIHAFRAGTIHIVEIFYTFVWTVTINPWKYWGIHKRHPSNILSSDRHPDLLAELVKDLMKIVALTRTKPTNTHFLLGFYRAACKIAHSVVVEAFN